MDLQIIQNKIFEIRGCRVMLDFHLAELYQVETRALKQAVKRNLSRFPDDFAFQLTKDEWQELITICDKFPENIRQSDCHRREYFHHACFRPHASNVNRLRGTS